MKTWGVSNMADFPTAEPCWIPQRLTKPFEYRVPRQGKLMRWFQETLFDYRFKNKIFKITNDGVNLVCGLGFPWAKIKVGPFNQFKTIIAHKIGWDDSFVLWGKHTLSWFEKSSNKTIVKKCLSFEARDLKTYFIFVRATSFKTPFF